jgi:biotin/methionine sulfoxide reductase
MTRLSLTSTHWGAYHAEVEGDRVVAMRPVPWDSNPSAIGQSMPDGIAAPCRVRRPAIRKGWLDRRAASREGRGAEPFVQVPWDEALDIVAGELDRVRGAHGNRAIFGGSYGWSSAGRFHHAQSQVHRFLNCIGGYTYYVETYSSGAARRVLPHIIGNMDELRRAHTNWSQLEKHCQLFVAFGGLPTRNAQVNSGGATDHATADWLRRLDAAGVTFVNVSPTMHDLAEVPHAEWLPIRPHSDTALILALCHVLYTEGLHDQDFLSRCTVGFERFLPYLLGETDRQPKTPGWAAPICETTPERIAELARRMAGSRTMVNIAWSLQRAMGGEQPYWALVILAAMLGQIGTPGGGIGIGYSCTNDVGAGHAAFSGPRLPQGRNKVQDYIPVARVSDLLLRPGESYDFDGRVLTYPDIRLVYWAGGNAFHHHQDINRLIRAWRRPETVIVHEPFWTAQAKHADIVLPATVTLERDDIGSAAGDGYMMTMKRAVPPQGEARDDYAIFAALSRRLGAEQAFTEGRDTMGWLRHLYDESRKRASAEGIALPNFDVFWEQELITYPRPQREQVLLDAFRADPEANPLLTPSGRLEIFSETIAGFGYVDFPGHPTWQPSTEWLGSPRAKLWPLHMLSSQPKTRLHSQYDHGRTSRDSKIAGREPITLNVEDAAERGIAAGDVVRVFNDRGAFLAGAVLSDRMRRGVVQISTGAWYDPEEPGLAGTLDKHGNPNMVTPDVGTSRLGQGCSAQSALVEIERFEGEPPPITAFDPPPFVPR